MLVSIKRWFKNLLIRQSYADPQFFWRQHRYGEKLMDTKWRVRVKIPYDSEHLFIDDVPGDSESEACNHAKDFLKSLGHFDPYDVDSFDLDAEKVIKYDAQQVEDYILAAKDEL